MSWALEAIEKKAMDRARAELDMSSPYMLGLSVEKVATFIQFFEVNTGRHPTHLSATEILEMLEEVKCRGTTA